MAKHKITREAAEAHDAEVREHVKRQQAAWEEKYTLMLALGYALPEGRLTPTARKQLHKRADKDHPLCPHQNSQWRGVGF